MNDLHASLPEVVKAYSKFNLLVPTATDTQLNPYYKIHMEEVPVDLSENTGDIFKVGSTKERDSAGRDIWVEHYSLSKPLLNKMAMAAGIQFNPERTYGERIDKVTYRAYAQGAMRKADGTMRTETDQKEICLEDEEARFRIEFGDKARLGIEDQKQATAAAQLFKGKWQEKKNKYGKAVKAYIIDESERRDYIERAVLQNMAILKKTWAEKAMTGAKLRVIRALLGVKGTYTKAELQRNFAIPTVVFSPDYTDPEIRKQLLTNGMSSLSNMFGMNTIETKTKVVEQDTIDFNPDMASDAFESDSIEDEDVVEYSVPEQVEETHQLPPEQEVYTCSVCDCTIPENVYEYSINKFGRPLCFKCQKSYRG